MNIEVMEQLLKDLAANVGYDLISTPFDTPFAEASIEGLPDSKQFFWPVPASILNDKEHEGFRKMCIDADIIDTVCTTSFPWPNDEEDSVAIIMIDVTRRRRGSIKFVYANDWEIAHDIDMAAVCNLLIHDLFPGEQLLAFQMDEDTMDEELDAKWNKQVCIFAACDVKSLLPSDYLNKPGSCDEEGMCSVGEVFDILYPISSKDILELKTSAILISTTGNLSPQIVKSEDNWHDISLDDKMLLVPEDGYKVDYNFALQQFSKEEILRQLPITRRITWNDMLRVQIERNGLYTISVDELLSGLEDFTNHLKDSKGKTDK